MRYSGVFPREKEMARAEKGCWRVLKVLEGTAEELRTKRPAGKQDGGRRYVCRLREARRKGGRLRAVLANEQRVRVRKGTQPYLTKAEWVHGEGSTLGSTL